AIADPMLIDNANAYTKVIDAVATPSLAFIFVASNVAAGQGTVNIQFNQPLAEIEGYIHEYSGILGPPSDADRKDTTSCGAGQGDCVATRVLNAPARRSLLFAYRVAYVINGGTSFDERETFNANVTEDRVVGPGQYPATATKMSGPTAAILGAVFPAP